MDYYDTPTPIGTKLQRTDISADKFQTGTVIANIYSGSKYDDIVVIEWEDGTITKEDAGPLCTISVPNRDDLQKDFERIKLMITESANILYEANQLAKKHNKDIKQIETELEGKKDWRTHYKIEGLFDQIDRAGWNTSSLTC